MVFAINSLFLPIIFFVVIFVISFFLIKKFSQMGTGKNVIISIVISIILSIGLYLAIIFTSPALGGG